MVGSDIPSEAVASRSRPGCPILIDWTQPARAIAGQVRAASAGATPSGEGGMPAMPAVAMIEGRTVGILTARSGGVRSPYPPGTIIRCDEHLWVQTGCGHVVIDQVRDVAGFDAWAPQYFRQMCIGVGHRFAAGGEADHNAASAA